MGERRSKRRECEVSGRGVRGEIWNERGGECEGKSEREEYWEWE